VAGILREGVAAFRSCGGDPADLTWALGPAIQKCHFEVGPEVVDAFRRDPAWHEGLAEPGPRGRPHVDLHGFLRAQALDLGMDPARDGSVARCTLCERELLYSFRGGDLEGRQWGWVRIATPDDDSDWALPLDRLVPNPVTLGAMQDARQGNLPSFDTIEALLTDLNS